MLKRNENHWDARFALATNYSFYPGFLNKTPEAISHFETLRHLQERGAPEAKHARVYDALSRLYTRRGKSEKAREALTAGLERHPDDEALAKALRDLDEE